MPWTATQPADSLDWLPEIAGVPLFDASQSQISADVSTIPANNVTMTTLTVTIVTGFGDPLVGATVTFGATGTNVTLTTAGPTDATGTTTATVRTDTAQAIVVSASYVERAIGTATITAVANLVSASSSTVVVTGSPITSNDSDLATITVTAKDAAGIAIVGASVTVSATGGGNTIAAATGTTNGSGVYATTLRSNQAGTKIVSAVAGGVAITATAEIVVTGAPPVEPTLSGLSRDTGSAAGGDHLTLTGTFQNAAATVDFGGAAATSVTYVNATTLTCIAPAHATGNANVTVTQNTLTSSPALVFSYLPAVTTTVFANDMETTGTIAQTLSPLVIVPGSTNAQSTDFASSGTHSVKSAGKNLSGTGVKYTHGGQGEPTNPSTAWANGVYYRYRFLLTQATIDSLYGSYGGHNGQIKLWLNRAGSSSPAWQMIGLGKAFSTTVGEIVVTVDINTSPRVNTGFVVPGSTWVEMIVYQQRTVGGGTGTGKVWLGTGGALALKATQTHANLGSDALGGVYVPRFGCVYEEGIGATGPEVYAEDLGCFDGWPVYTG